MARGGTALRRAGRLSPGPARISRSRSDSARNQEPSSLSPRPLICPEYLEKRPMTSPQTRTIASMTPLVVLMALALSQCGDKAHCEQLRNDTYEQWGAWAQCTSDEDCFPLAGNPRDCTGVLSCPFAVNRKYRVDAERRQLTIGEDSVDCHVCAVPNCNGSLQPHCEPLTHQCLMIEVLDAGATFGPPANLPEAQP